MSQENKQAVFRIVSDESGYSPEELRGLAGMPLPAIGIDSLICWTVLSRLYEIPALAKVFDDFEDLFVVALFHRK